MRNYNTAEDRIQRSYRSYDYILEKHIGRPSRNTTVKIRTVQRVGIFLTGLFLTLFVLAFAAFVGKEPVEASDGLEVRKDYICVEVEEGDCLWDIAEKYGAGACSLEDFVAETEEINGIRKDTVLQPGNKLMIPCYKMVSR